MLDFVLLTSAVVSSRGQVGGVVFLVFARTAGPFVAE